MECKIRSALVVVLCAATLVCMSHCAYGSALEERRSEPAAAKESSEQMIEAMLHSMTLYVLAVEILSYLEDGSGGVETLAQKYSAHPGWIPAFGKAVHDPENHILYVPLGQCVWKIFIGDHGDPQFGFLQPTDTDLDASDRNVLAMHLFRLMNEADMHQDALASAHNALAAESLLFPSSRRNARPSGNSSNPAHRKGEDLSDNL